MSMDTINTLTSIIGSIGVIASLMYLAMQIRQNTRSIRASTYQDLVSTTITLLDSILNNENHAALVLKWTQGCSLADLTPIELTRTNAALLGAFRSFDNTLYQRRMKTLDPVLWPGYEAVIHGWLQSPVWMEWFIQREGLFTPELGAIVRKHAPRVPLTQSQ
ncbi:MAG: hypothetical protein H0W69_09725, partial [Gemmatimonadaceae bacterium]|nr:hypothetical protein [Gemmatimonadaceae bacterium]